MKTHHALTVRGQPRVFQQPEGGANYCLSRAASMPGWGAISDFLPSSNSSGPLRVAAGCGARCTQAKFPRQARSQKRYPPCPVSYGRPAKGIDFADIEIRLI